MTDITQMDLYALFDLEESCSVQELTTAFRKKALACHPDKYPDDKEKTEHFLLIKKALELLTDSQARQAYDACRKQKQRQQERLNQMDETRKKFKETLERNEQKVSKGVSPSMNERNQTDRLRAEVERLRREGNRLVIEELEKLHQIVEEDMSKASHNAIIVTIKYFPNRMTYTDEELRSIFGKYGEITTIINRNPKSALIEFNATHISIFIENEKGLVERPFASVKLQKRAKNNDTSLPTKSKKKQQPETIDLTKPDFEEFEKIMLKKMSQHAANSS